MDTVYKENNEITEHYRKTEHKMSFVYQMLFVLAQFIHSHRLVTVVKQQSTLSAHVNEPVVLTLACRLFAACVHY